MSAPEGGARDPGAASNAAGCAKTHAGSVAVTRAPPSAASRAGAVMIWKGGGGGGGARAMASDTEGCGGAVVERAAQPAAKARMIAGMVRRMAGRGGVVPSVAVMLPTVNMMTYGTGRDLVVRLHTNASRPVAFLKEKVDLLYT